MKMKQQNERRRLFTLLLALVCLLSSAGITTADAAKYDRDAEIAGYYYVLRDRNNEDTVYLTVVVRVSGQNYIAYSADPGDGGSYYIQNPAINAEYPINLHTDYNVFKTWSVSGIGDDDSKLITDIAAPIKGETVSICYITQDSSGDLKGAYDTATVTELAANDKNSALLKVSVSISEKLLGPGIVLNKDNACVGILIGKDGFYTDWYDETAFKGNGSSEGAFAPSPVPSAKPLPSATPAPTQPPVSTAIPSGTPTATPSQGSADSTADSENSGKTTDLPGRDDNNGKKEKERWGKIGEGLGIVLIGLILIVACVLLAIKHKHKSIGGDESAQVQGDNQNRNVALKNDQHSKNDESSGNSIPDYVKEDVSSDPESFKDDVFRRKIGNQRPQQNYPKGKHLYLECRGGYQDGRLFLISSEPITIGRDAGCTIRYPMDYPAVSRFHATLQYDNLFPADERGTMAIELTLCDNSSTGTLLKRMGKVIPKGEHVPVHVGDVFYIGERKNRFEIVEK